MNSRRHENSTDRIGVTRLHRDEGGASASAEMVMVLPIFIFVILLFIQFILVANATMVMNYAAYNAARSAIVWWPDDTQCTADGNRPTRNTLDKCKKDRIRKAAVISLIGISPPPAALGTVQNVLMLANDPSSVVLSQALNQVNGFFVANDVDLGRVANKYLYANNEEFTKVEFPGGDTITDFGAVTVDVKYRFFLNMPLVGWVFGEPYSATGLFLNGPYYAELKARMSLINEGEKIHPQA